jgi:predicted ATPase/class 3 adenylate cyclase
MTSLPPPAPDTPSPAPRPLPSGTVTFLFTDIEGSTQLWERHPEGMKAALAKHDSLLRSIFLLHQGHVFKTVGDAFCVAFASPREALQSAVHAQQALQGESWGETPIRVRMALHCGEVEAREDDYFGQPLNHVARLLPAGHGGQVLVSTAMRDQIQDVLPGHITLRDMGERRLKDLVRPQHIYQLVIPDLINDFPPLKTLDSVHTNLPAMLSNFIGREKEIAEIKHELGGHRLVTLTGSGGTGKTRLALQVAAEVLDSFPDGVWFVELAPLSDPELVPSTILSTLGNSDLQGKTALQALAEFLQPRKTLIVLDNCEHLIAVAAQTADAVLGAATDLKILATSREALGVKGELAWHVPSLSLPDPRRLPELDQLAQYEAVRLFVDRTLLVSPNFAVHQENAPAIAQICYRLDGIPLALELAAARARMLSVDQISSRLDDRFRLLTGGARTALPRQQTLRALIDWSYDLLSENERLLLRRLAVFSGGWTLELAEQVCSDQRIYQSEILDILGKLVDKSLVAVVEGSTGTRYRILETVRQYAREKLFESGEGEKIRDGHLKAFVELAEEAEPEIRGADQLLWLDRLDDEIDNLRAALEWSRSIAEHPGRTVEGSQVRDPESFLRLASALWRFWSVRGYIADLDWLPRALAATEGSQTVLRARAVGRASFVAANHGDPQRVRDLAKEAEILSRAVDDKPGLVMALTQQGDFATDRAQGLALLDQALALAGEIGDHWSVAGILISRADLFMHRNDLTSAKSLFEQGVKEARLSGDKRRISYGLSSLGEIALAAGDSRQAEKWFREALAEAQAIRDNVNILGAHVNIVMTECFSKIIHREGNGKRDFQACSDRQGLHEPGFLAFSMDRGRAGRFVPRT